MLIHRVVVFLLLVLWLAVPAQAEETCQECQEETSGGSDGDDTSDDNGTSDTEESDQESESGPCQVAAWDVYRPQDTVIDPDGCFKRTVMKFLPA